MAPRRASLPGFCALAAAGVACWSAAGRSGAFVPPGVGRLAKTYGGGMPVLGGSSVESRRGAKTSLAARGGGDEEAESVEVGGFSGFVVGLALLPYVANSLTVIYGVVANGASFALGSYGLEAISCFTSVGITLWSIGSFIERGRGLPAGPLGLLGLAEGLAYLASLGLAIAGVVVSTRTGGLKLPAAPSVPQLSMPAVQAPAGLKAPEVKVPDFKAPEIKVPEFKKPDIKVPELKAPDIKVPEFKKPDIKVPEFKAPEIKVPEIKKPDIKVPEVKLPEVKAPSPKAPEAPKAPEPKKEPEKKPEKKAEAPAPGPAKKAEELPDYDMLFD